MLNEAIILAGGFGTRLREIVNDVPKPMAPVNDKPFLEYLLRYLQHYRIKKVVFSTGYLAEKISDYFGNSFNGIEISYSHENSPLGTGGGIRLAMEQCNSKDILVLNGDSFFDIDINAYYNLHTTTKVDCSLSLRSVADASRYGTVSLSPFEGGDSQSRGMLEHKINSFNEKNGLHQEGLINAGVYILNRELYLAQTPIDQNFSIEKDFFEKKINELNIFGFNYDGYFIDIGIPEDYTKAQNDFKRFAY